MEVENIFIGTTSHAVVHITQVIYESDALFDARLSSMCISHSLDQIQARTKEPECVRPELLHCSILYQEGID